MHCRLARTLPPHRLAYGGDDVGAPRLIIIVFAVARLLIARRLYCCLPLAISLLFPRAAFVLWR